MTIDATVLIEATKTPFAPPKRSIASKEEMLASPSLAPGSSGKI